VGCGDGIVAAAEECDDGNTVNTDSCTAACKFAKCGDGIVGPGETCDDANTPLGELRTERQGLGTHLDVRTESP